jgi:hypothetical protein
MVISSFAFSFAGFDRLQPFIHFLWPFFLSFGTNFSLFFFYPFFQVGVAAYLASTFMLFGLQWDFVVTSYFIPTPFFLPGRWF